MRPVTQFRVRVEERRVLPEQAMPDERQHAFDAHGPVIRQLLPECLAPPHPDSSFVTGNGRGAAV